MVGKITFFCSFFLALTVSAQSGVIKDDFRVNNDTTGTDSYQPCVLIFDDNSALISWHDLRNGNYNIYAQKIQSDGSPLDSNFKVSTNVASTYEYEPSMIEYGDSILVVFQYGWGQWILRDGTQQGNAFSLTHLYSVYDLDATIKDTVIFAVGRKYISGGYKIVLGRYTLSGTLIGDTIHVNEGVPTSYVYTPVIATSKNGNIVVAWSERRETSLDIYAQIFDSEGNKIGSNFIVNTDTSNLQDSPAIAMDSSGNFVIIWADYRNAHKDIYGRMYDSNGNPAGSDFLVNDDGGTAYQDYPDVAMDSTGNFIVVWTDSRDVTYHIYCQFYDSGGNPIGSNFKISDNTGPEYQYSPSIYTNGDRFIVAWEDQRDDRSIYYRIYSTSGTALTVDRKANDCSATRNQYYPAIDMNSYGYCVVAWEDLRDNYNSIYYSAFDQQGNVIIDNFLLQRGKHPDVAVRSDSSMIITFSSVDQKYIYYYLITSTSVDSGSAQDTTYNTRQQPAVAAMPSGRYAITWFDTRWNGYYHIYLQYFDKDGNPIGNNILVDDDSLDVNHYDCDIAVSPTGKFLVVWYDWRMSPTQVFGQLFDSTGTRIGQNFIISDSLRNAYRYRPAAAYLPTGRFFVVWQEGRIHGQLVDTTGALVDTNFLINDPSVGYSYEPNISVSPSGRAVVVWRQSIDGNYEICARSYSADFSTIDSIVKVNNAQEGDNPIQRNPAVAANDSVLIFAWEDPKWFHGYDIAAKVVDWNFVGVEERNVIHKNNLKLLTPIATDLIEIEYTVSIPTTVKISISDIAGRRVKILNEKISSSLTGRLSISASEIKPGIYFITMDTGGEQLSRKVILVK